MRRHNDKKTGQPLSARKRSPYWIKVRNVKETDCVICGYQKSPGTGQYGAGTIPTFLRDTALCGTGRHRIFNQRRCYSPEFFNRIRTERSPFSERLDGGNGDITTWLKPLIVCRIEYLTWTANGLLRHPVFRGIRTDKTPAECILATDHPSAGGAGQ